MKWVELDPLQFRSASGYNKSLFVLCGLADCDACIRAKKSINLKPMHDAQIIPISLNFKEMNPAHKKISDAMRIKIFPQGRLYVSGKLVSAWEGLTPGCDDADITAFVENWLQTEISKYSNVS